MWDRVHLSGLPHLPVMMSRSCRSAGGPTHDGGLWMRIACWRPSAVLVMVFELKVWCVILLCGEKLVNKVGDGGDYLRYG